MESIQITKFDTWARVDFFNGEKLIAMMKLKVVDNKIEIEALNGITREEQKETIDIIKGATKWK